MITKLQKLYSLPTNLRAGNKLPTLFLKKPLCMGHLFPMHKIFIKRPDLGINQHLFAPGQEHTFQEWS